MMQAKTEKYYIRILVGILLAVGIFYFYNYIKDEQIIEKSRSIGGKYRHFDLTFTVGMFISICASVYLIAPSVVYFTKNILHKKNK